MEMPLRWGYMPRTKIELSQAIEEVLALLRQGIAMHGGDVKLIDVDPETGKVQVELVGACVGCPMSDLTLKAGIEDTLMQMIPEVKEVINVTSEETSGHYAESCAI